MKKLLALSILLFFAENIFSQRAMILTNPEGKDVWIINNGEKVRYEIINNPLGYYTGIVEDIKDSSFIVGGEEIKFSLLSMIKVPRGHGGRSIVISLFFGAIAAAADPINVSQGNIAPHDAVAIAEGVFGAASVFYFIKGIVELSVHHKCYMKRGWRIKTKTLAQLKKEG